MAPALSQRVMVPHNRPHASVALVNLRAGALVDGRWIDVHDTGWPIPGNSELIDVERVCEEVWIASSFWIYRYEAGGDRPFIASFYVDAPIRSLEVQSDALAGRVLVTTHDSIRVFDAHGIEQGRLPIEGAGDTLESGDSMLVALQDDNRIDRYTFDGQWLGTFAGPSVPTALGLLSEPRQLSRRRNGNLLVAGDVRIYEFTAEGEFVGEYDVGPFEGGVIESVSGRLFVPLQNGMAIYDVPTERATLVGGLYFGQGRRVGYFDEGTRLDLDPGEWTADVTCRGAAHSGDDRARIGILGSPALDERSLTIFVDRMPPQSFGLLMLAPRPGFTPAGAIGHLCLDRRTAVYVGDAEVSDASGQAMFQVVRGPQAIMELGAGSTWFAQSLFRDGTAMRLSSAMTFTLKP